MENTRDQGGEEAPMYSDSYLLPVIQKLDKIPESNNLFLNGREDVLKLLKNFIKLVTGTIEQGSKILEARCAKLSLHIKDLIISEAHVNIGSLSSQITIEILSGNDTHSITLKLLNDHLLNFYWFDKVAITLAAFAVTFGNFWLLVRVYAHNVVNEPTTGDQKELRSANKEAYRKQIEANNEFVKMLVTALGYLFDIIYSRFGDVDMSDDRLAIYVYWIVRCTIVAATQIIVLSSTGLDQYLVGMRTPTEFEKLKSLHEDLIRLLFTAKERERALETTNTKLEKQVDIVGFMRVLITDNEMPPLYHGETKTKDHLDVLRGKRVLLLISGIDISSEDITSLKRVIVDTREDEIVWIPVINNSAAELDPVKNQLETLQNSMAWYSVQPSMVTDDAIYFFETKWDFKGEPILVILSPSGRTLRYNAIHMVRIWQNLSVDNLTIDINERELWKKETWNLKLLVNDIIDPIMQKWIEDKRYIIMYGGNDIDWIQMFARQAHYLANDSRARIEVVYVGNRHNKDLDREVRNVILSEQLSHCLPESSITYFWTRVDSMMQMQSRSIWFTSNLLQERIQQFRSNEKWALLARGSTILANGPGQIALNVFKLWRDGRQSCYIRGFTLDKCNDC